MDKRGAYWLLFDPVKGSFYDFVLSAGLIVLYCACWLAPACWPPIAPPKFSAQKDFFFPSNAMWLPPGRSTFSAQKEHEFASQSGY